jgi:ankyrin repeat protein
MKNRPVLLLLSLVAFAAQEARSDETQARRPEPLLFQAIRRGDSALVASLLRQGTPANLRGENGTTPLLLAARYRNAECVKLLLDHGADPNSANEEGATALHWGAGSLEVVRLLLERWADPRARTQLGNTPLISAAAYPGSGQVVKLLLEKGADPHAWNGEGDTALTQAVMARDLECVKLLAERGAVKSFNERPEGKRGEKTALRLAASGAPAIAEVLLDHGAEIDHDDAVFTGHALNAALFEENAEVARLLIERGANLQLKSAIGKVPPMVWSAYRETEDTSIAEMLLKKGADINAANEYGETALTWARRRGHQRMVSLLLETGAREPAATAVRKVPHRNLDPSPARRARQIISAVETSIRLLQRSSDSFLEQRECVSCHHQFLPAMALGSARDRGFLLNEVSLRRQVDRQVHLWSARKNQALEMQQPVPVPPHFLGAGLLGLAAIGYPPDDMTEAMASYLASTQGTDGRWAFGSRPPLDHGAISATVKALRVLQVYPVEALRTEFAERVARARDWLIRTTPRTHTERFFRLLGLGWSGADPMELEAGMRELISSQSADGGWSQLPGLESDAWATGGALVALHSACGLPATHPVYGRGVDFLLRTQFEDGSWWVPSRSWPFQTQFDSRFPHGKDQWISAGATAMSVMALVLAVEPSAVSVAGNTGAAPPPATEKAETPAAATTSEKATPIVDFLKDIKPMLERSCLGCHSGAEPKSRYLLTTRKAMLEGGESGKASIIPGDGAGSLVIRYVSGEVEDLEMPPLGKRNRFPALTAEEITKLRAWIDQGALVPEGIELRPLAD